MHLVSHLLVRALDYLYFDIWISVIVTHPPMYIVHDVHFTMCNVQCTIYNVLPFGASKEAIA